MSGIFQKYFGLFSYIYDGTVGHVMSRYVFPLFSYESCIKSCYESCYESCIETCYESREESCYDSELESY